MKFLIIQTAFIGDVVLATSILEKLHRFYPESKVDFLVRKGNESLFDSHPFLNQVLVFDKQYRRTQNLLKLVRIIRKNRYSHVINIHRFASSGLLTALSGASHRIGFDKNPLSFFFSRKVKHVFGSKERFVHEVDRNLKLIEHLTDGSRQLPVLYPKKEDLREIIPVDDYVCIAPASVWTTKQLPEEKWIRLIRKLPENIHVVLIGGPADREMCIRILEKAERPNMSVIAGRLTYLESCSVMGNALMNYVNDSAPTHFASAVNAPVTTIFCSTIPEFGFTPLSDKSRIIETSEHLECRPCGIHGKKSCPLGHFKCADLDIETGF